MKEITLTINDKEVKGKEGDTVLEICQANGIDVPTLCHLQGLSDVGACRMCVVEIEKERRSVPACVYPARDGLVVKTHTERVEKYRRQILELIFAERNHFCMFCEQSGDCELQKLAYRYQMDNVRYPYTFPSLPVDSLNDCLVIDHNRCVLCGRCIRECSEIVGLHTLDFGKRGWRAVVTADLEQSLGESTCTSCGACVQVCPTGAITGKFSAYKGRESECQVVRSVCPSCGAGCEVNVFTKDNNVVKIEAPEPTGLKGPLCSKGRFDPLREVRPRIITPLVPDGDGELKACSWDEALDLVAKKIGEDKGRFAGIVSGRLPNEALSLFSKFVREAMGSSYLDTLDGENLRVISRGIARYQDKGRGFDIECSLEEILAADCVLVVSADPLNTQPVVGSLVHRAVTRNGAKLIVINSGRDVFPGHADLWLQPREGTEGTLIDGLINRLTSGTYKIEGICETTELELEKVEKGIAMYGEAQRPVIIYGDGIVQQGEPTIITSLLRLSAIKGETADGRLRIISLKSNANSRGAWDLGLASGFLAKDVKGVYVLLGDDELKDERLLTQLKGVDSLVVQASFHSSLTAMAQVVLPSPIWGEREGEHVTMDGQAHRSQRALDPPKGVKGDEEILAELTKRLTTR